MKASTLVLISLKKIIFRPSQHDDGYIDGRSQIKVHTDERTQVQSARSLGKYLKEVLLTLISDML